MGCRENKDKPTMLVVDDEPTIRVALERWFTLRGFQVDVASDGEEAVAACLARPYDIVTMDLDMPRMGGLEAMALIHKQQPELPIIVLTGYMRNTGTALGRGAAKVCVKPVRLAKLEMEVREILSLD